MAVSINLLDGGGYGDLAKVSPYGQLVVAPLDFSTAHAVVVDTINTAFNFVGPVMGKQFVVTDILIYADKGVGVNDASVDLYEATGSDVTTVSKAILCTEMVKQTTLSMTGLNLIVTEGRWLNIKTNDNTIFATVMGYYVSVASRDITT